MSDATKLFRTWTITDPGVPGENEGDPPQMAPQTFKLERPTLETEAAFCGYLEDKARAKIEAQRFKVEKIPNEPGKMALATYEYILEGWRKDVFHRDAWGWAQPAFMEALGQRWGVVEFMLCWIRQHQVETKVITREDVEAMVLRIPTQCTQAIWEAVNDPNSGTSMKPAASSASNPKAAAPVQGQ